MLNGIHLTPTERLLFDKLKDGEPHSKDELMGLLDTYTDEGTLRVHFTRMRPKLREIELEIISQHFGHYTRYRLVKLLRVRINE